MTPTSSIDVRVIPNASRSEISGWIGTRLKIKVMAPPDGGRANQEVIATLAKALSVAARQVAIVSGDKSREKRLQITGISEEEMLRRLPAA